MTPLKCEVTGCQPNEVGGVGVGGKLAMNVLVGVTVRSPASQLEKRSCSTGIVVDLQQTLLYLFPDSSRENGP